jgi:hypothetical protein
MVPISLKNLQAVGLLSAAAINTTIRLHQKGKISSTLEDLQYNSQWMYYIIPLRVLRLKSRGIR